MGFASLYPSYALLLLAGCALLGAIVVVMLRIDARREHLSGEIAMAH